MSLPRDPDSPGPAEGGRPGAESPSGPRLPILQAAVPSPEGVRFPYFTSLGGQRPHCLLPAHPEGEQHGAGPWEPGHTRPPGALGRGPMMCCQIMARLRAEHPWPGVTLRTKAADWPGPQGPACSDPSLPFLPAHRPPALTRPPSPRPTQLHRLPRSLLGRLLSRPTSAPRAGRRRVVRPLGGSRLHPRCRAAIWHRGCAQ